MTKGRAALKANPFAFRLEMESVPFLRWLCNMNEEFLIYFCRIKIQVLPFYLLIFMLWNQFTELHWRFSVADRSANLNLGMNLSYYFGTLDVYDKTYYLLSQTQLKSNLGDNNYKNSDCRPNLINKWAIRWNNSPISPKNELIWAAKQKMTC